MENFTIPMPFHICVDDVGWFCPRDDRTTHGPSRTGATRFHLPGDYSIIEEIGEAVGMKLSCGFVIGEWDMEDTLSKLPHFSHFGRNWNNSAYRDPKQLRKIAGIINDSPHIDFVLHGLYHGYYMDGTDNHDCSDFFYRINKQLYRIPETEVRQRIGSFFHIMEYHNIKKDVTQFIPPSFAYREGEMSAILKTYGIDYISTIFRTMMHTTDNSQPHAYLENGIAVADRLNNPIPWERMNADFDALEPVGGILGIHWPNFLHDDPGRNRESAQSLIRYVRRCCAEYGTTAAYDMKATATQYIYRKYADVTQDGNTVSLDLSRVPKSDVIGDSFFVSAKSPLAAIDGTAELVTVGSGPHFTYSLTPKPGCSMVRLMQKHDFHITK